MRELSKVMVTSPAIRKVFTRVAAEIELSAGTKKFPLEGPLTGSVVEAWAEISFTVHEPAWAKSTPEADLKKSRRVQIARRLVGGAGVKLSAA